MEEKAIETGAKKGKRAVKGSVHKDMNSIAGKAIKELERIAFNDEEPIKIRMDILKWFAELSVGKPKALNVSDDKGEKSYEISISVEE